MISVAIVDDKRDIREGLQQLLNMAEKFECVETYADAKSAIEGIRKHPPDVVLMDINLPEMSGIECVKVLRKDFPTLDIIMLSAFAEDEYIFQSLKAGAFGYLTKNTFPSEILSAIEEVRNGGAPMSTSVARRVVTFFNSQHNPLSSLSNRESEVLDLLCDGLNHREIAEKLFVSPNTVRFHLKNIYKKLQVSSRHEAVAKATRAGLAL